MKRRKTKGTKHGKGKGKYRVETRSVINKAGKKVYYYNYRERTVRKKGGKRVIRYRKGGKGRGPR